MCHRLESQETWGDSISKATFGHGAMVLTVLTLLTLLTSENSYLTLARGEKSFSQNVLALLRRFRGEAQKNLEGSFVLVRVGGGRDVKLRDQIAPSKELVSESTLCIYPNSEIGEVQDSLVTVSNTFSFFRIQPSHRTFHFVADHQNLLIQCVPGPIVFRKRRMLAGHLYLFSLPD
jgi:hypothetical protein